MKRSMYVIPVLLFSMVGLSACGGEQEASTNDGSLFEFASITGGSVNGKVQVQLPKGLTKALDMDGVKVPVKSVTLSAHEVKSTSLCAVDGAISYNDGGEKVASTPTKKPVTREEAEKIFLDKANFAMGDYGIIGKLWQGAQELVEKGELSEADLKLLETKPYELYMSKLKGKVPGVDDMASKFVSAETPSVEEMLKANTVLEKMSDANWVSRFVNLNMNFEYGEEILPMDKFNADAPKEGLYMDSTTKFIQVLPCVASPVEKSNGRFLFNDDTYDEKNGYGEIATFHFGVMKDGTITIPESKVKNYKQDTSGNWIKAKK
ncbi:hypothetical protein [Arcanobacterium haemolyticum]